MGCSAAAKSRFRANLWPQPCPSAAHGNALLSQGQDCRLPPMFLMLTDNGTGFGTPDAVAAVSSARAGSPPKYSDVKTSGLTFDVQAGEDNVAEFDLE